MGDIGIIGKGPPFEGDLLREWIVDLNPVSSILVFIQEAAFGLLHHDLSDHLSMESISQPKQAEHALEATADPAGRHSGPNFSHTAQMEVLDIHPVVNDF